jgi:uncharacterized protein (TIGR03000 family)
VVNFGGISPAAHHYGKEEEFLMDSVLLMAALSMGTLVVDTQLNVDPAPQNANNADPAPKNADNANPAPKNVNPAPQQFAPAPGVVPTAEYIYPLPVVPKICSRYANLAQGLPAGVPPKGVRRQTSFPGRALLIIRLPPEAEVYFNWHYIKSDSDRRTFLTGDLLPDHSYFYDVKVTVIRNYRPYVRFQRVFFRPGEVVEVYFGDVGSCPELCLPFALGWY